MLRGSRYGRLMTPQAWPTQGVGAAVLFICTYYHFLSPFTHPLLDTMGPNLSNPLSLRHTLVRHTHSHSSNAAALAPSNVVSAYSQDNQQTQPLCQA